MHVGVVRQRVRLQRRRSDALDVDDRRRADEGVERQLVRARPAVAHVQRRVGVRAHVRASDHGTTR